jgi:hypothetical protein
MRKDMTVPSRSQVLHGSDSVVPGLANIMVAAGLSRQKQNNHKAGIASSYWPKWGGQSNFMPDRQRTIHAT